MEPVLHRTIYEMEKKFWWYAGRRLIIFDLIGRFLPSQAGRALDIGCGSGLNASFLPARIKEVIGIEVSDEAIKAAAYTNPRLNIIKGTWPEMSVPGTFNLIICLDVLEHIKDDGSALRAIESLLAPNGIALLTVPAFPFLWSDHDTVAHHFRRYTQPHLRALIQNNTRLEILCLSYFNFFLFVPIVLFRLLKKIIPLRIGTSDIFSVPKPINTLLTYLFGAERFLIRAGNLPVGVSLLCILKKQSLKTENTHATIIKDVSK
ncbi:MAG: class I SAM-dependent methyltransferase [Candidatus Sungbacteria bacterium]|nr:class I SAM-dependent methyltransferase [bacterium]MDZ4260457.1 class I SAM-dependent methyltransferase [Candidatus Sungbacteria bacterium]